ncbi:hypothetical protein QN277_009038 [Acacia crassicarpa]|uniref:Uncharacterized protein n=1 Tax=Acacia crassicarpa TaxID=499986 RepID=A0AAE1JR45_9FABA|nr:hypothetical protein QN277_009038 [Acacia crassicarpa]
MCNQPYRKSDIEAGPCPLYPTMLESPELRWSFIRKVYSIIILQLLATIVVAFVFVFVFGHPFYHVIPAVLYTTRSTR